MRQDNISIFNELTFLQNKPKNVMGKNSKKLSNYHVIKNLN
ncbi:hypothetical protein [Xenorhabdus entomophaga]|nr:hypothetical protein [Xenorhabdus sp. PB62.4]